MNRTYKISLSPEFYSDTVHVSQYDSDYNIIFNVFDKYSAASSIDGMTAHFTGTRSDGLGFTFDATASGSSVSFEINTSMTAVAGTNTAEIVFYDANDLYFGSANVQVIVEPAARPNGTIDADTERAEEIAEEIQQIVDTAAATVEASLGTLSNLTTTDKSSVVAAINEVDADVSTLNTDLTELQNGGYVADQQQIEAKINTWLNEHPEATTTVQDGSITTAKIANGAITEGKLASNIYLDKYKNLSAVPAPNVLLSSIGIDYTGTYTMQGACYNSDDDCIIMAFHESGNSSCKVVKLNSDWTLASSTTLTLYHANDMTYNPRTGLYYVADGENANTIYSVDTALTTVTTISVAVGDVIAQISYDNVNDRYYLLTNGKIIYTCDSDFTNVTSYATLNTTNDYSDIRAIYIGGSCMMGETFVSQLWFYSSNDSVTSYTRLCLANADKAYTGSYYDFSSYAVGNEAEALISLTDKIVSIGYTDTSITRYYIYINGYQTMDMVCTVGNTYRNVNYVPVNTYGVCTIQASSSPTGSDITGAYICYGSARCKTLRITVNDTDYYRYCYGQQAWTPWHSNKEILTDLIITRSLTIASDVTISANTSTSEYSVTVASIDGYTPFMAVHRQSTSPVVFPWYVLLSGTTVTARYRNTYSTNQTDVDLSATVMYVRNT